ncbi:unnamed protein product [Aureobasidium mustum]|uniref:Protein kinase domain-containing protein n=1 Tax=Aureobasidium mustum TaxID=2773714 RepID=A0A9N8PH63_9PEZI|nr:unnamed protein product [Aureobasidium mustum]
MQACVNSPFETWLPLIDFTATAFMFDLGGNVVIKSPFLWTNPTPFHEKVMEDNIASIEKEKEILSVLRQEPHPNIVHTIVLSQQGIFLERLVMSLSQRLKGPALPISPQLKVRWIQQIVNNILLDERANIKLIDFDCTVKYGDALIAATTPFAKLDGNLNTPLAGAESETFAIGSCIYNIHFDYSPLPELEDRELDEKWSKHEYPSTGDDELGVIIRKCWNGEFESLAALDAVVKSLRSDGNRRAWSRCNESAK